MFFRSALINPTNIGHLNQLETLHQEAFGDTKLDEPILGETYDDIVANNFRELVFDPKAVIVGLVDRNNSLFGFSLAIPIGEFDPSRMSEDNDTAYIYWSAIKEGLRGKGLIGPMQEEMHKQLSEQGFTSFEEDVMIENGYAANVITAYAGAISMIEPHIRWPEVGYQARVRIDLTDPSKLPR